MKTVTPWPASGFGIKNRPRLRLCASIDHDSLQWEYYWHIIGSRKRTQPFKTKNGALRSHQKRNLRWQGGRKR